MDENTNQPTPQVDTPALVAQPSAPAPTPMPTAVPQQRIVTQYIVSEKPLNGIGG